MANRVSFPVSLDDPESMDMVMHALKAYEGIFSRNSYDGANPGNGEPSYRILRGSSPILLSAPHSVNQTRNGGLKQAEIMTGGIALLLHKITGAHVIVKTYHDGDANYDEFDDNTYQQAIASYLPASNVELLIDIHGALAYRPFAIDFGTSPTRDNISASLKKQAHIVDILSDDMLDNLENMIDIPTDVTQNLMFAAITPTTVTHAISDRCGLPCIQAEINRGYRDFNDSQAVISMLNGFYMGLIDIAKDFGY